MSETIPEQFTIVNWNILLDKTRTRAGLIKPQSERIASQAGTLIGLGVPLDVVMIQEAEETKRAHNGKQLARALGFEASHWTNHNTSKRSGEYIGTFGNLVQEAEFFDVGHDKRAVLTMIGEVAVVGFHNRREVVGFKRTHQMAAIIERVAEYNKVVLTGDTNDLFNGWSRRLLRENGFRSAAHVINEPVPVTFPTPAYRNTVLSPLQRLAVPVGLPLDDIVIKGVGVESFHSFEGDSDHRGLVARINPHPPLY